MLRKIQNPYFVIVLSLATLVLGVTAYRKLPADLLPIFETPAVQILTFYPGMPPEVMDRDIMSRLERWTGQSVGIEHQEAKAMLGVCIVKNFFQEDISLETAMSQVTSYAMSDMFYLPPGTIPPMVMPFDPTASMPLCLVTVSSPTMDEKELYDVAYYELRNQLQAISGVIAPAVYGGKLRRIMVYVDPKRLEAWELDAMDVVESLRKQNVFIPAGNMKAGDLDYQIIADAMTKTVEDLNDIPITVRDGKVIRVRDVGRAEDSAQIQSNIVRINGRRQAYIPIYRQPGANTIEIVQSIQGNLERILQRLRNMNPKAKDLALEVVLDQSVYVRESVRGLQMAGLLGALLAGVVVFAFLRQIRPALIVFLSIPLSILAAFFGLFLSGATINAMTLGGLALAVGILVDQSILVLENIVRHVHMGKDPMQASLDGSREVALPVLSATTALIVVFFPILFLSGMTKFLFKPIAMAASMAIIASYIIAITVVPAYCARFLRPQDHASTEHKTRHGPSHYERWVEKAIGMRGAIYVVVLLALGGAVYLMLNIGTELFPKVDAGQFQMMVRLPSGTRIEHTEEAIKAIEEVIISEVGEPDPQYPKVEEHADSNLKMLISNIGVLMDWPAAYTPNAGPMDAFVLVDLKKKKGFEGTFEIVAKLRKQLNERFPGIEFSFDTGGMLTTALNMGEPAPIHLQVSGSQVKTSHDIASVIVQSISGIEGLSDVRILQKHDYPIWEITINRLEAALAGIEVEDLIKNMVTASNSSIGFDPAFWVAPNGNHYFIGVQYPETEHKSLDTLLEIPIRGRNKTVPLRTLVTTTRSTGPTQINHRNITRVIDVYAGVDPGYDTGSLVSKIEKQIQESQLRPGDEQQDDRGPYFEMRGDYDGLGYVLRLSGEIQTMRKAIDEFIFSQFGFGLAIVLIYLVLALQFQSFIDPLVIVLTLPLGFIGVAVVLFCTGTTLNIQSMMGLIMMAGIVVEYSIVLIDFANRRVREGIPVKEAIVDAARVRARPILMTAACNFLALLPMAIGWEGGDANVPLARTIVGGVLGAAALTLFVVPCLYVTLKGNTRIVKAGEQR